MAPPNGAPGRPNAPTFITSWGERIERAYVGKDGKLRIQGRSRPAFSLKDERRAVAQLKRALAELSGNDTARTWTEVLAMNDDERRRWQSSGRIKADAAGWSDDDLSEAVRAERERLRNLILTDPEQAATELRIPHLADYPSIFRNRYPRDGRNTDQQDAYSIARWLWSADEREILDRYARPPLTDEERRIANLEGWILGIA